MTSISWANLTEEKRLELYRRRYINGEDVASLASALGMNPITLNRNLQRLRQIVDSTVVDGDLPIRKMDMPDDNISFYEMLKKGPWSLSELSKKFDRSEATILSAIESLEREGFVFETINSEFIKTTNRKRPVVDTEQYHPVMDETDEIVFAVASDLHAGSIESQPSARAHFIHTAYHKYGVRNIFDPGDTTTGVSGYRGQEFDIVPDIRPSGRRDLTETMLGEVWLADAYSPKLPGLSYYILGGNHDYWGVTKASIDPIFKLANMRDDTVYLGYDMADVPLTENLSLRLWHPGGGSGTSLTAKLQRGVDRMIRDEFYDAVRTNRNPKSKIIIAGHLHIESKFQQDGVVAIHPGCFEGLTNFERRLGLMPVVGGAIISVSLDRNGFMRSMQYTFIPYDMIHNDWENWPTPPQLGDLMGEHETITKPVFTLKGKQT